MGGLGGKKMDLTLRLHLQDSRTRHVMAWAGHVRHDGQKGLVPRAPPLVDLVVIYLLVVGYQQHHPLLL